MGEGVLTEAVALADRWRSQRRERAGRRSLERRDFEDLAATGYLRMPVPVDQGGTWRSVAESTRGIADVLRTLAAGDPSPALVAAMHPAVLAFWLGTDDPAQPRWDEQRRAVLAAAAAGAEWGTITSEPGSGGDVARTRTAATPAPDATVDLDVPGDRYLLTGDKHFGSGTGICSFMLTTALPEGEDAPSAFFLDTRALTSGGEVPGFTVTREWDGVGMAATQSHAARLEGCPAVRFAWDGPLAEIVQGAAPLNVCVFAAVVLGVVDEAMATARAALAPKADTLRPYEQVEWARACADHWLAQQALEGLLRAIEDGDRAGSVRAALLAKVSMAELVEQVVLRIGRVVGGGTFSRSSPYSAWFEDVRALGFLRPPWGLAFDSLLGVELA